MQQQQELAQLVGKVGFQAVGMVAQKFNLADGSPEKIALHAAVMSGGAVGAVLAGNGAGAKTGAAVALDRERYNRQLHPQIKPFINAYFSGGRLQLSMGFSPCMYGRDTIAALLDDIVRQMHTILHDSTR